MSRSTLPSPANGECTRATQLDALAGRAPARAPRSACGSAHGPGISPPCDAPEECALRREGERGADLGDPGEPDQHGQAERPRPSHLSGRCARADDLRTHAGQPTGRAAGLELEGRTGCSGDCCGITSAGQPRHTSTSDEHTTTDHRRPHLLAERRRTSMDVETAIQAFASAGNDLPQEAAEWALDHWDEAAPELLSIVERYTSGADRSDEAARAVLFILHLAGEKQDARAFALLCRLAQDGEAIEAALGDGTTTTLKRILISTYDGDLDTLKGLIEAVEADEFVRAEALEALAYLTATGRIPRDETQA